MTIALLGASHPAAAATTFLGLGAGSTHAAFHWGIGSSPDSLVIDLPFVPLDTTLIANTPAGPLWDGEHLWLSQAGPADSLHPIAIIGLSLTPGSGDFTNCDQGLGVTMSFDFDSAAPTIYWGIKFPLHYNEGPPFTPWPQSFVLIDPSGVEHTSIDRVYPLHGSAPNTGSLPAITLNTLDTHLAATFGSAMGFEVYLDDHDFTLPVLAVSDPEAAMLELNAPWPNPAMSSTRLAFTMPNAAITRLVVTDCAGRTVRELVNGPLAAGPHSVDWSGTDGAGRRLPNGIYFVHLASGRAVARAQKIALIH